MILPCFRLILLSFDYKLNFQYTKQSQTKQDTAQALRVF